MTECLQSLPPAFILFFGAFVLMIVPTHLRRVCGILFPALAFLHIAYLPSEASLTVTLFEGFPQLELMRADGLAKAFGFIFALNGAAGMLFGWYLKDRLQPVAALCYIGCAIGAVFAKDLISLYIFWELMAVTSTALILARRSEESYSAGRRYLLLHLFGGLLLLAGILIHIDATGETSFVSFLEGSPGAWFILAGILVNAAAPPFGAWLPDAYPAGSVTAGVLCSGYTTKTAVYTLLRGFPGWEILIVIGCIMTVWGIIYALLENDMRRILAYSIINQVGFMVCAAGIGTPIALNGAVAHAFCHIIYKSLLWMSAGAVLYRTGKSKCTDLGGLYKSMPWTLIFGTIGALAISAVPLTSGFTSKTLIIQGAADSHLFWAWVVLEIASAGVFLHAGIKFPYFVFFAKDRGMRPKEAPISMLSAMFILSFLCIFLGVYPDPLYAILPFPVDYHYEAYTFSHIVTQSQLLTLSALTFFLFLPLLKRTPTIVLDADYFYRLIGQTFFRVCDVAFNTLNAATKLRVVGEWIPAMGRSIDRSISTSLSSLARITRGCDDPGSQESRREREYFDYLSRAGFFPVGIAAVAPLVLLVVFLLL